MSQNVTALFSSAVDGRIGVRADDPVSNRAAVMKWRDLLLPLSRLDLLSMNLNPVRVYRNIAFFNLGCGAILGAGVVVGAFMLAASGEQKSVVFVGILLLVVAVLAMSMIMSAVSHLKEAQPRTVRTLALNSTVIIWLLAGGLLGISGLKQVIGPAYIALAMGIAFLSYWFFLKPVAMKFFAEANAPRRS